MCDCGPIKVEIELDTINQVDRSMRKMANDLRYRIDAEYPEHMREQYPALQLRWERAMEMVQEAERLLAIRGNGERPPFLGPQENSNGNG